MTAFRGFEHVVREQQSLAPYTWFRLGGQAEYFAEPTSSDELQQLVRHCAQHDLPVRLLGGGSRILVPDTGVKGLVIHLGAPAFGEITVQGSSIRAGGGAKLGLLVSTSVREGLGGIESLVGIPGTVAGALRGNASSSGASIGQWTSAATVMTRQGEILVRRRDQLRFSSGESSLDETVLLDATLELEPADVTELTRRMQKAWILKRTSQPSGALGTGRIFKDPQGVDAAELIENAGLRGHQIGSARIADSSANFIEVQAGATSDDVKQLIRLAQERVAGALGVHLECELEIW
jgi:UDP-N-acetylmuramate dehydrogenase